MARQFQRRERNILVIGAIVAVLILVWWAGQGPLTVYRNSAQKSASAKLRLQQAQLWHAEVEVTRKKVKDIEDELKGQGGFDLWTHIDSVVKILALGSRANIRSDRVAAGPTAKVSAVRLQLTGVNVQELVELLHKIYAKDCIVILDSVQQMKPAQSGKGLDCTMVFLAPKL